MGRGWKGVIGLALVSAVTVAASTAALVSFELAVVEVPWEVAVSVALVAPVSVALVAPVGPGGAIEGSGAASRAAAVAAAAAAASTAAVAALVTVGVGVSLIRVGIFK